MAWTPSVYPCLKPRGQQLTKNGEKENHKHSSLLFPQLQTLTAEGPKSHPFKM